MVAAPRLGSRDDDIVTGSRTKTDVPHILPGGEIVTFFPLQVALHFNAYFSPLWFLSSLVAQFYKISMVRVSVLAPLISASVIAGLLEVLRIYLGYEGNLREKVSRLITFWFLSVVQIAFVVGLITAGQIKAYLFPMEAAADAMILLFLITQLFLGFEAIRRMIRAQAVKFHLTQYRPVSMEEVPLTTMNIRTKVE